MTDPPAAQLSGPLPLVQFRPRVAPAGATVTTAIAVFGVSRYKNYGRNLWDPAAEFVGWPKNPDGKGWHRTFHSLRHVFATWALAQPGIRIEDVSRLMGHSSIRATQEIYVHVSNDVYDRFFEATS